MSQHSMDIVCFVVGIMLFAFSVLCLTPQLIKTIKTKNTANLSLIMYILYVIGSIGYVITFSAMTFYRISSNSNETFWAVITNLWPVLINTYGTFCSVYLLTRKLRNLHLAKKWGISEYQVSVKLLENKKHA